ncbi:hypothetical protein EDC94DRAFT_150637 [Helicostylum pulchrum]|nr:hypothetical protein EDC94DRAFT_150637 [Helicostylum pulchrum]
MLNSRLAVGVSQSGGMIALYDDPNDTSFESRLKCLFSFHYPDIIVKPSLALLRSQNDLDSEADLLARHLLPWSQEMQSETVIDNTVPIKPIVGCTVSGGIIHVYRISPALYNLLHTLQEILIEFEPTAPLLGSMRDFKKWYCGLSGGEKDTVHGDLVESYLRLSAEDQLAVIGDGEGGGIKPQLLKVIKVLCEDTDKDLMIDDVDASDHVFLIRDILSGFERYR